MREVQWWIAKYPPERKASAVIPVMWLVQKQEGWVSEPAIRAIAQENLTYGRLAWQTPINGAGTQAGAAWSQMRYELGKDFADLDAHGRATIGSLYLLHSVILVEGSSITALNGEQRVTWASSTELKFATAAAH